MSHELLASARPLQTVAAESYSSALLCQHSAAALQHSRARMNRRLPIAAFAAARRKITEEESVMRACPCSPRSHNYCKHGNGGAHPAGRAPQIVPAET